MTLDERIEEIVEEFSLFDDWLGKYEYLIELGRSLPVLDDAFKTEAFRIHGCQSQVWVRGERDVDTVRCKADSDAIITKGLIALLIRVLDDQPTDVIVTADFAFLDEIGLKEHLSPTRKNGLSAMVQRMKAYARSLDDTPA